MKLEAPNLHRQLSCQVIPAAKLTPQQSADILNLCSRAYNEDFSAIMATFSEPIHLLGSVGDKILTHALWVTRWLKPGNLPELKTAYVEAVATEPEFQGKGLASLLMRRLVNEIKDFDLGALCAAYPEVYARLGWELWQGPLFIRQNNELLPSPPDAVMIMRLPKTPHLDLSSPLSAEWRKGELW